MTENERHAEIENLYRQAFAEYGSIALWNLRPAERPTAADALAITKALRTHGRTTVGGTDEHLCRAH